MNNKINWESIFHRIALLWNKRFISKLSLCLVILIFAQTFLFAQTTTKSVTVKGIVTSVNSEPLRGVVVQIKGTDVKMVTKDDGKFAIPATPGATLIFSSDGYVSLSEVIGQKTEMAVQLKEFYQAHEAKDYVNMLGGFKQNKNNVSSAVSQIYGSRIENNPIVSNANKLPGLLPGLMVMQSNGDPAGEDASMWIRGKRTSHSKSPMILIDGVERDIDLIDPQDIETVTVLKDAASTAQYGMRGGNGIILITTKRGEEGKIKVSVNVRSGIKEPTTTPKFLDSYDYATLYNEAFHNDNPTLAKPYSSVDLAKYMQARKGTLTGLDKYLYPNINWYNQYMKDYTWQQRYSMNISGGNKYAKYFVSGGYTKNNGLYKTDPSVNSYNTNSDMDMITLRSNIDINVTKKFKVSLDLSAKQQQRTYPGDQAGDNSTMRLFRSLYKTPPNAYPLFNPDGSIGGTKDYNQNAYGLLNKQGYSLFYTRRMASTFRLEHDLDFITRGLKVKGNVSFDSYYEQTTSRNKAFAVYQINTTLNPDSTRSPVLKNPSDSESLTYTKTGSDTQMGTGGSYGDMQRLFTYEVALEYSRQFGRHSIYAYGGFSQREIGQENNTDLPRIYRGYNGRFSYSFGNKYLADFTVGYQGSEQMPPWAKYTVFPAGSIGWVISQENCLKNSKLISLFKLRASHGLTGLDDLGGSWIWFQQFGSSGGINFGNTANSYNGWNESAFALNNVQPERVRKSDVGIDLALFNNRISFSGDYFYEHNTKIMVAPESLPWLMGIRFPNFPVEVVDNKGYDMQLTYSDHIGKVEFAVTGVYTKADNKVVEMGEAQKLYPYQMYTGRPLDPVFGLVALGLFQNQAEIDNSTVQTFGVTKPGDIKYKNVNGDDKIDAFDKTYLGNNADPTSQFGVNLSIKYKGFDLSGMLTGQKGGTLYMTGESIWEFHNNGLVREHHLGRFNPDDETTWATATYPRLSLANKANNQSQTSTYWGTSSELYRLKNVELGYTIPERLSGKLSLQKMRFYVNAYNLLTWQSTDLLDVEARSSHYVTYPIQRIINAGLNVTF